MLNRKEELVSEPPDKSGRSAVIVLGGAEVVGVHVVSLKAPGEILEGEFVVEAATYVDFNRVIDEASRVQVPDAGHGMDEWAEISSIHREAWAAENVVLSNARTAVEATAIDNDANAWKAGEGKIFEGGIPSAITLLDHGIGELRVRNSDVNVSVGKKRIELCCHRNREQKQAKKSQHGGCGLRHELFLPGAWAG